MMPVNKVGNTRTMIQNIVEPFEAKMDSRRYVKKIGTMFKDINDSMSFSTMSVETNLPPTPPPPPPLSNKIEDNRNPNMINNSIWDRGKTTAGQHPKSNKPRAHDVNYLKHLESNLESYLYSLPKSVMQNANLKIEPSTSPNSDDILIDVDIESFDSSKDAIKGCYDKNVKLNKRTLEVKQLNNFLDDDETISLSNFHNVRDLILSIQQRLTNYLSSCEKSTKLEMNMEQFLKELDEYINAINVKKEYELRKFSENISNQKRILHVQNAFQKKDLQIYDTLESDTVSYYSSDSISGLRNFYNHEFIMKNCYDQCSTGKSCSDTHSIEYYSMLINEDRKENLLNDAPPPLYPRYERDKISLIFQNPDNVIKEWQKYHLNTITIEPKKNKFVNFARTKKKNKSKDFNYLWSFTLDYHRTKSLQLKLEKEKKIRFLCRTFFCFLGIICFIFVVLFTQSIFNNRRGVHL